MQANRLGGRAKSWFVCMCRSSRERSCVLLFGGSTFGSTQRACENVFSAFVVVFSIASENWTKALISRVLRRTRSRRNPIGRPKINQARWPANKRAV